MRVGSGFDVHKLVEGRDLIIGGVRIEFERGLEGHSDADVLVHAIIDALLGAAGMGDIGQHFPPSDPGFKDADSLDLLAKVAKMIRREGFVKIINIDSTIMAERPKMLEHVPEMKRNIARVLGAAKELINIKATTTEKLGFIGREEGIAAMAVCLISEE